MASIGKDLATIRKHLGLSLDEIHRRIKMPLTTLKQIEDDSLLREKKENPTYIRSFVRSYAKALKVDDDLVLKALDQWEVGNYNHLLLSAYPDLKKKVTTPELSFSDETDEEEDETPAESSQLPESSTERPAQPATPPVKPPEIQETSSAPSVENVNWAAMGHKFKKIDKSTPVWIIGLAVILIIALVSAYFIYETGLSDSNRVLPDADNIEPPAESQPEPTDLRLELQTSEEPSADITALDDTLHITLYAAYDKLEPVRVWSDLKPRVDPYWLDQGIAYNFEFRDTIRIQGQYSRMLLFLNGNRIDNFRQEYFNPGENAVELTRDLFDGDNRWATPIPPDLPNDVTEPDTIMNRPTF